MNKEKRTQEVVDGGMIDGIKYYIVENGLYNPYSKNWGIWYCAYIVPPFCVRGKDPDEDIEVFPHGGITWKGYLDILKKTVWGWDYNHSQDITFNYDNFLETKLQVLGRNKAIEIIRKDIEEYIGGLLDEIGN